MSADQTVPPQASEEPAAGTGPAEDAQSAQAGPQLGQVLAALKLEILSAFHDRIQLLTLETRQIGIRITQMVLLATLAALFICTAWVALMVALYMAGVSYGWHWATALAVVLAMNLLGAFMAWWTAHRLSAALTFPATRRMIRTLIHRQADQP